MKANRRSAGENSVQHRKERVRLVIERYLRSLDRTQSEGDRQRPMWHQSRPNEWTINAVGSHLQDINIELSLGDYSLQLMSFFVRQPDLNKEVVYSLLLRRNLELSTVKFGSDEAGDLYVRADLPLAGVTEHELDRAVGIFYACADHNWETVVRLSFATGSQRIEDLNG